MGIGERLREVREELGYSQEQFGEMAGVKKTAQYNYERDERSPDAKYLSVIAAVGADVLYVLTGERHDNVARTSQETGLLTQYRRLSEREQLGVLRLINTMTGVAK